MTTCQHDPMFTTDGRCSKCYPPKRVVMVQHDGGIVEIDPDVKWAGRTVYLTTTVDNGIEHDALIQHSTPYTVAEARADAKHDLDWFGVKQGFKVTCRISIDNVFEEISEHIPGWLDMQHVTNEQARVLGAEQHARFVDWQHGERGAGCAGNSTDEYDSNTEGHW